MLDNGDGHIDFGEPDASQVVDGDLDNVAWFSQDYNGFHWWYSHTLEGVVYGDGEQKKLGNGLTAAYSYEENLRFPVMFNTATRFVYTPRGQGQEILHRLVHKRNSQWVDSVGVYAIDCEERSDYEDIKFSVNEQWISLKASDYIHEFDGVCFLGIIPTSRDAWVFGTSVFEGYYTIFDQSDVENARIGIAPHASSEKDLVSFAELPKKKVGSVVWELTSIYQSYGWLGGIPLIGHILKFIGGIYYSIFGVE